MNRRNPQTTLKRRDPQSLLDLPSRLSSSSSPTSNETCSSRWTLTSSGTCEPFGYPACWLLPPTLNVESLTAIPLALELVKRPLFRWSCEGVPPEPLRASVMLRRVARVV